MGRHALGQAAAHRRLVRAAGVVLDLDLLQFPQGVITDGRDTVTEYSGLAEYTLNIDSQRMGLRPDNFLNVMAMSSFGDNVKRF